MPVQSATEAIDFPLSPQSNQLGSLRGSVYSTNSLVFKLRTYLN